RLRQIDEHGAPAPPEHVERREVAVHDVGREHPGDLLLELGPDARRRPRVEVRLGEPRRGARAVADERHAVAVLGRLDGRRYGDAGVREPDERVPFVRDPAGVNGDVSVAGVLAHGAALAARTLAPNTAVRRVVAERPPVPGLEAFLREERGLRRAGPRDEVDLAFFAGL